MTRSWFIALAITIAIEGIVAAIVNTGSNRGRCVRDSAMANLMTHPIATLLYVHQIASFASIEVGVFLVEGLAYRYATGLSWRRAFLVSLACNGVTAGVSLILD